MARVCAAAIVVLLAVTSSADAATQRKPRFRSLGSGAAGSLLRADDRHAAWQLPGGDVALFDSRDGGVREVPSPPGCRFADVGGGKVLWSCGVQRDEGRVLDVRTGAVSMFAEAADSSVESVKWTAVGEEWVQSSVTGYHYSGVPNYHNLRTREVVYNQAIDRRREIEDLDLPGLRRGLCPGVGPEPDPEAAGAVDLSGTGFLPFEYRQPYGVRAKGR